MGARFILSVPYLMCQKPLGGVGRVSGCVGGARGVFGSLQGV